MVRTTGGVSAWDVAWLVLCGLLSSAWCVTAAPELGATFDEPIYVRRGLEAWRSGSHHGLLRLGTMPLPIDVQTLPLYLWERWHGTTFDPEHDLDRLLPWVRAGTLVFWWVFLTYGWLIARSLAGPWSGRLAVALLAFEPCFLANACLATTDIALTACLLGLIYHFRRGRDAVWWRRVALPALWLAATILSKASGLVYGPICLFVIEVERLIRTQTTDDTSPQASLRACGFLLACARFAFSSAMRPFRRDVAVMFSLALVLVFVYCGSDWQPQPTFVTWANSLPEGSSRTTMVWLAENLRIFSNAGEGLVRQIKHNLQGHGTYLLGEAHTRAFWYYFPVLLTIKLSLPLLLAPLVVAALRPRALLNWACLCALVLVLCSLQFRVQIGIRMVLPLVALGSIGLAAALVEAAHASRLAWQRAVCTLGAVAAVAWTSYSAVAVWPQALCYTNEFWGSTSNGYRYVSDANYDWGQGVKELVRWQERTGTAPLAVWCYSSDKAWNRTTLRDLAFHASPIRCPDDAVARVRGHYVAVSTTLLYGPAMNHPDHIHAVAFFRRQQPVTRTATYLIYDFTERAAVANGSALGILVGTGDLPVDYQSPGREH